MRDTTQIETISRDDVANESARKVEAGGPRVVSIGLTGSLIVSMIGYMRDLLWPHHIAHEVSGEVAGLDSLDLSEPRAHLLSPVMTEDQLVAEDLPAHRVGSAGHVPDPKTLYSADLSKDQIAFHTVDESRQGALRSSDHLPPPPDASNDNGVFPLARHPGFNPPRSNATGGPQPDKGHGTSSASSGGSTTTTPTDSAPGNAGGNQTAPSAGNGTSGGATTPPAGQPRLNHSPTVSSRIQLNSIGFNQVALIGLASLLTGAADPDGDSLRVTDISVSSGTLQDHHDGTWSFTPVHNDDGEVTFSYFVTDGLAKVAQTASLDILPGLTDPVISGTDGADHILGTPGSDVIVTGGGADQVDAGGGNDIVYAGAGAKVIFAGDGDDFVFGGSGNDIINAGGGNDHVFAGAGDDIVFGGDGNDLIDAGSGNDVVSGDSGDDVIIGGQGTDVAAGGSGDDTFIAVSADGDDTYDGEQGKDTYDLSATSAPAMVDLQAGKAESADIGTDQLRNIENVIGSKGDDVIIFANDEGNVLTGGGGDDTYVIKLVAPPATDAAHVDLITDFSIGDIIDLSQMDANKIEAGHQKWTFGGDASQQPAVLIQDGQVLFRFEAENDGEHTIVYGTVISSGDMEFTINLVGHQNLTVDSFHGVS